MNISLRRICESLGYAFGIILISALIVAVFHRFNLLGNGFVTFLKMTVPIIAIFIGSYLLSSKEQENGWKNGLFLGVIYFVIMFFLNIIVNGSIINMKQLLFFIILIMASMLGGMMGVYFNQKEVN